MYAPYFWNCWYFHAPRAPTVSAMCGSRTGSDQGAEMDERQSGRTGRGLFVGAVPMFIYLFYSNPKGYLKLTNAALGSPARAVFSKRKEYILVSERDCIH